MRSLLHACFLLMSCYGYTQEPSRKIALVIGVQNYINVAPLRHSLNDASAMATSLKAKGFEVDLLLDPPGKKEVRDAIARYYNLMRIQQNAVGIIYYAGHGIQFEGENYLIPASASLQVPGDLEEQCVRMNMVMSVLTSSDANMNILLLDACRSNSFPSFNRDVAPGLGRVEAPKGSIVVFATQPGTVASDGSGQNGLFTSKLLKYIDEPGLNIGDVLRKVKQDVNLESGGKQLPSVVDNSIGGDFFFTPAGTKVVHKPTVPDFGYKSNKYATVSAGTKTWSARNLNLDHFSNGDPILEAKTAEEWLNAGSKKQPAWCYYDNDPSKGETLGKMYNWYAIHDPRGLAPRGWHIATPEEWSALGVFFGDPSRAGVNLKNNTGWDNNGNGVNRIGFGAVPGGYRVPNGTFHGFGRVAAWWSLSDSDETSDWAWNITYDSDELKRLMNYKTVGLSVRCVQN